MDHASSLRPASHGPPPRGRQLSAGTSFLFSKNLTEFVSIQPNYLGSGILTNSATLQLLQADEIEPLSPHAGVRLRRRADCPQLRYPAAQKPNRPNIVVILIDDMGFSDLQCYGGEVPSPNINKLAAEGVRFTQFYNTGRCSPSRAALLTGLYPHEAGMGFLDNLVIPNSQGTLGKLRNDCVTMAEVVQDAGYFTIMTGKWHLGQLHGTPPHERGFMRSLSAPIGELYFPNQQQRREVGLVFNGKRHELDDPMFGKNWYGPDLITDWGLKFIDESIAANKPFFYYLPYCAVHFPLQVPQADIDRYRGNYMVDWQKLAKPATNGKSKWAWSTPNGPSRRCPLTCRIGTR